MIDPRAAYEALLNNVDRLMADVDMRQAKLAAAKPITHANIEDRVAASLAESSKTAADLRAEIVSRTRERETKIALAKHIFHLSRHLAA